MSDPAKRDAAGGWLAWVMHAGFYLVLASSAFRLVGRHGWRGATPAIIALVAVLAVGYTVGMLLPEDRAAWRRRLWLAAMVAGWLVLVMLAPSFAFCAVPLFFLALPLLPTPATVGLAVLLTAVLIVAQVRLAARFDASLVLVPVAVAGIMLAVFVALDAQSRRQQALIAELVDTRDALAAAERTAGVLAERGRLAADIHDSLAQGFSSVRMLLQAAERSDDPAAARRYLAAADRATADGLAEARRFIRGLAPAELSELSLPDALRALADRVRRETGIAVTVRVDGDPAPAPAAAAALLRVAQTALANILEHAHATTAVLTLSSVDDDVTLDVYDDGVGFDTAARPRAADRGDGLRLARDRLTHLGGTLTVESDPGRGTVLAALVPREPR